MSEKPKIRQIEAVPVDTPKGRIVVLRDPFGFTPAMLELSQHAFYIASLLDGTREIKDIQAEFLRMFGQAIDSENIEEMVAQLDACYFLDNDRYVEHREKIVSDFINAPLRSAFNAGLAYPDKQETLGTALSEMFSEEKGGRHIDWDKQRNNLRGLVVPHIDFERGSACYGLGYAELVENSQAKTFIILGTAHCGMSRPYCLTLKDFETPFGPILNDRGIGEELLEKCPWLCDDEFSHRSEHSIEFQALLLKYLFAGNREVRIVPILCGLLQDGEGGEDFEKCEDTEDFEKCECSEDVKDPDYAKKIEEFLVALKDIVSSLGDSVCLIASADMSHVGARFGDKVKMGEEFLEYLSEKDLKTLESVAKVDAEGFSADANEDGGKRKICGLPPVYAMLRTLEGGSGRLVKYMQSVEKEKSSVVTFATAVVE